jgi:integrase
MGIKLKIPDKPNKIVQRRDYLTAEEVKRLLAATTNVRDYTIIMTFLHTGLRAGLLCAANVEDVDLHRGIIIIDRNSRGDKNHEGGSVLIGPDLHEAINQWLQYRPAVKTNALYFNENAQRFTANGVRQMVHKAGVRAGIGRNVYPHLLRATMATTMDEHGWGIKTIQRQMLQKDPRSTMVYLRSGERELREKLRGVHY